MSRVISVHHGDYPVNEYEVDVTQAMRDQALAFAAKIKLGNNQFSRLLPATLERTPDNILRILKLEIQRTYVGKLGELVLLSFLTENGIDCDTGEMFTIYDGQENTDSYDFMTNSGLSVDVKTGFRSNHTRLLVNRDQFERNPKELYVGVKLNGQDIPGDDKLIDWDSVQTAVIKGYAEKTYLERVQYRDFGEGLAKGLTYNRLMGIERLLSYFK